MITCLTYKYDNITDVVLMCLQLTLSNVLLEIHILCQHADLIPQVYLESCQISMMGLFGQKINKDAWRNLVPFVQFKKCEKHPWRSATFSKVASATLLKVTLLHGCFSRLKIEQMVPHCVTPQISSKKDPH